MKKTCLLTALFLLATVNFLFACEVCQAKQPEVLKGITHGSGPQGNIDYIIIWSAVAIVTVTLILSIKFLVKPGEDKPEHIKNIVVIQ